MAGTRPDTIAWYVVPVTNVAAAGVVGVVVVPYKTEYVMGAVPVIPAASNVTVIEVDVGDPETAGTVGAPDGAVPAAAVDILADTADVCVPPELATTDLK